MERMENTGAPFIEAVQKYAALKNQRRSFLENHSSQPVYGIDFIRVRVNPGGGWDLGVNFFQAGQDKKGPAIPPGIGKENIRITHMGIGPTFLQVDAVTYPQNDEPVLSIHVTDPVKKGSSPGSTGEDNCQVPRFILQIVHIPCVDSFFSRSSFYLGRETALDPQPVESACPESQPMAEINYLAKDFASFRSTILDHMALSVPQWQERHIPDLGIALVDLMAYAADYLSYYQDAAATEAYLETARCRVSLQRHTRLLDYHMHNGCNSRITVQVQVDGHTWLEKGTPLLTRVQGQDLRIPPEYYAEYILYQNFDVKIFETMHTAHLHPEHNRMYFYDWGIPGFILEKGTTTAVLEGHFPGLKARDLLILGNNEEPHPFSHLVRLTCPPFLAVDSSLGKPVTHITWAEEDALPRDCPVSGNTSAAQSLAALGNIVLADFGRTIAGETLPTVPASGNYRPRLKFTGLVYAVPYDAYRAHSLPARQSMNQDAVEAVPALKLVEYEDGPYFPAGYEPGNLTGKEPEQEILGGHHWTACRDLLASGPFARNFTVETEEDGTIYIRFGDGKTGKKPAPGTVFKAFYRVGTGIQSRADSRAIAHIVTDDGRITGVYNPAPSSPFTKAESRRHVRFNAPQAFKTQERCITPDDYAGIACGFPGVQDVQVRIRWTGSWHTVFIYVDRQQGKPLTTSFKKELARYLEPFRPANADINILAPFYVGLCIRLTVYLASNARPGPVRERLIRNFCTGCGTDGAPAFFNPGNFGFGQTVYLSQVLDCAMREKGVRRVDVDEFRRFDTPTPPGQKTCPGHIPVSPLEILRLDNIVGTPGNGTIMFNIIN